MSKIYGLVVLLEQRLVLYFLYLPMCAVFNVCVVVVLLFNANALYMYIFSNWIYVFRSRSNFQMHLYARLINRRIMGTLEAGSVQRCVCSQSQTVFIRSS